MERTYFDICFDVIRCRGEGKFFCLNPAQRAAEKILTKYNVAHSLKTTGEMDVTDAQSFFRAFPLLRRALLVTPRAFYVTLQNPLNMQKAARFMQRAAFSFMRFLRRFRLRIVDHFHLRIGEIERLHVLHLFDLRVNHRFKRRRVEPDSVLAENLLSIDQLLVAIACSV